MQWNNSQYGGFSSTKPWLPVNQNRTEINVEKQKNDPNSLLNFYRSLIKLRKGSNALKLGKLSVLKSSKNVFAYLRFWKEEQVIVALNFSSENILCRCEINRKSESDSQ